MVILLCFLKNNFKFCIDIIMCQINLNFVGMKAKTLLKSMMVAVVLFTGAALFASSSDVVCSGVVTDLQGNPVANVQIRSTLEVTNEVTTEIDGSYSISQLQRHSTVTMIVPDGYVSVGSTVSQSLTKDYNTANFTLRKISH